MTVRLLKRKKNKPKIEVPVFSTLVDFQKQKASTPPNRTYNLMTLYYSKLFGEHIPEHIEDLLILNKIEYELVRKECEAKGYVLGKKFENNYKAAMRLRLSGMSPFMQMYLNGKINEEKSRKDGSENTGGNKMPTKVKKEPTKIAKKKVVKPSNGAAKVKVSDLWIKLFSTARDKSNDELVKVMNSWSKKRTGSYTVGDVAQHRSLYNNGRIKGQPSTPRVPVKVKKEDAPKVKKVVKKIKASAA